LKYTCIIVDDEPFSISILEKYAKKVSFITVLATFTSSNDALLYLKSNKVDIIFLDIMMPDTNGFQLIDNLDFVPQIILTSSSTEFAYTAYQYHVDDYLKKPITYTNFIESLNNLKNVKNQTEKKFDNIFIKSHGNYVRIKKSDILYIESTRDYAQYITSTEKYSVLTTLKSIEEKIDQSFFIKIHRSYIVNIEKITNFRDNIVYIGEIEIPVSKTYKNQLLQRLNALV
jgi:DNA-binding LytR/AlgR family response regulator